MRRQSRKIATEAALAALLFLALAVGRGDAHGYISSPKARQVRANELNVGNVGGCPHCMQGGRAGVQPDICGAPGQGGQNVTGLYFGPEATLRAGQVVDFGLYINAQHGGRHWFSMCPLPRQQATQACFDRPEHQLIRADGSYADGKRYYYQFVNQVGSNFILKFRLPPGITCVNQQEGCMIQWNWAGYQSGALACESPTWDVPQDCGKAQRTNNVTCDPNASWQQCIPRLAPVGDVATENYINCIDVVIQPSDGTPPPPNPSPSPPPSGGGNSTNSTGPPCNGTSTPCPPCTNTCPPTNSTCAPTNSTCAPCRSGNTTTCPAPGPEKGNCTLARGRDRAVCLCRKFRLASGRYADIEFGCSGAIKCASTVASSDYMTCGSDDLFSQAARSCRPADTVTCGLKWGV